MINAIVCVDNNFGIGKNNDLLYHLKGDMKFFREKTKGTVVSMGYNTLLSMNGPLKNRTNLVLAPDNITRDDCIVVHSLDTMLKLIKKYVDQDEAEVFIIGGGTFYKAMLEYCDRVYVTKVDAVDPEAQVFFPNIDNDSRFKIISESETFVEDSLKFKFVTYGRN